MNVPFLNAFPLPWRVEVDPFGQSADGIPNIFVVDGTGAAVLIVGKHPVWNHMEQQRMNVANEIVRLVNAIFSNEKDECVNGLKHMAAYKSMSLDHVRQHGLKDGDKEQYVTAEQSQLKVFLSAIFLLTGEKFTAGTTHHEA